MKIVFCDKSHNYFYSMNNVNSIERIGPRQPAKSADVTILCDHRTLNSTQNNLLAIARENLLLDNEIMTLDNNIAKLSEQANSRTGDIQKDKEKLKSEIDRIHIIRTKISELDERKIATELANDKLIKTLEELNLAHKRQRSQEALSTVITEAGQDDVLNLIEYKDAVKNGEDIDILKKLRTSLQEKLEIKAVTNLRGIDRVKSPEIYHAEREKVMTWLLSGSCDSNTLLDLQIQTRHIMKNLIRQNQTLSLCNNNNLDKNTYALQQDLEVCQFKHSKKAKQIEELKNDIEQCENYDEDILDRSFRRFETYESFLLPGETSDLIRFGKTRPDDLYTIMNEWVSLWTATGGIIIDNMPPKDHFFECYLNMCVGKTQSDIFHVARFRRAQVISETFRNSNSEHLRRMVRLKILSTQKIQLEKSVSILVNTYMLFTVIEIIVVNGLLLEGPIFETSISKFLRYLDTTHSNVVALYTTTEASSSWLLSVLHQATLPAGKYLDVFVYNPIEKIVTTTKDFFRENKYINITSLSEKLPDDTEEFLGSFFLL